jgi:hypothetical protein
MKISHSKVHVTAFKSKTSDHRSKLFEFWDQLLTIVSGEGRVRWKDEFADVLELSE